MLILKVFTMGRRKEIDLDKMKVLYNQGLSDYEIAKKLNCSRKTIFRRREELGLPVNYWQSPIWNQVEEVKSMLAEGKSGEEICKKMNFSHSTLTKFKKKYDVKGHYDMKMSKEDIDKAMQMAEEGYMDTEIGKVFGVTGGNIQVHRKNRNIESKFTYDKVSKIDNKQFETLFNQGLGDAAIAKALGMSTDGIYSHRMRQGYLRESHAEAKNNPLTQDNLEIILGIMMGDGSMEKTHKNARMTTAHSPKQKEYTEYIMEKLSNLNPHMYHHIAKPHPKTGKCYENYALNFPANPAFNEIYEHFYRDGKKRIPIELFDNFTWQSLAYMYMDDGSKASCGAQLATLCFTIEELRKFQDFLLQKFGIETTICKSKALYIKARSYRLMKIQIEPYMCECTKYKIGE